MQSVIIDEIKYVPETSVVPEGSAMRICMLARGNVLIGRLEKDGDERRLHNASVIRRWGTTAGLGQLAQNGPTSDTILDPCNGVVEWHVSAQIMTISVNESAWA